MEPVTRQDITRIILAAATAPLLLVGYVVLIWLGLPTAEYVTLVLAPTLSVVVGFVLAGKIASVRRKLDDQHREIVTVLSDQNVAVAQVAAELAAVAPPHPLVCAAAPQDLTTLSSGATTLSDQSAAAADNVVASGDNVVGSAGADG